MYEHVLGTGWNWNIVGSGISSLVGDATGNVFALKLYGQTVYEHVLGTGWNWNIVGSGITSLVSDMTGNVFALIPGECWSMSWARMELEPDRFWHFPSDKR